MAKTAYKKAIASVELEGYKFTKEELDIFKKLDTGEMTDDQFWTLFREKLAKLKQARPEAFAKE